MKTLDCVVIGGGLAGLATAYGLRARDVLLLERERRIGGRVLSVRSPHGTLDLGACFAVGKDVFPDEATAVLPDVRIAERGPIRYVDGARVIEGDTAWSLIEQLPLSNDELAELRQFRDGAIDAAALSLVARRVVDALFKQIHPGDIAAYSSVRQRDALAPLYPDHYPLGNGCAVEAYEAALEPARVVKDALVTAVVEDADGVTVTFARGSRNEERVRARYAVIATPGDVARTLITPTLRACAELLAQLRYGTYTAVGVVLRAPTLARFRYIVSPSCPLDVVVQQAASDEHRSLLCYYSDPHAESAAALTDEQLIARTREHLATLGVTGDVVESAVRRWRVVGTIMTAGFAAAKAACDGQATARVVLAGDYLGTDASWGYGTVDAVASGRRSAALVEARLSPLT